MTIQGIAKDLRLPQTVVQDHVFGQRKRHGRFPRRLNSVKAKRWSHREIELLRRACAKRVPAFEIADRLERTLSSVNSKKEELRRQGLLERSNLDVDALLDTIEERLRSETIEAVANSLGIARATLKDHLVRYKIPVTPLVLRERKLRELTPVYSELQKKFSRSFRLAQRLAEGGATAFLEGSLLGDASIGRGCLDLTHSTRQGEWALIKYFVLWLLDMPAHISSKRNKPGRAIRVRTLQLPVFHEARTRWYGRWGKKGVPTDVKFTDAMVAVWYADDGYLQRRTIGLATHSFQRREVEMLARGLKVAYGIEFGAPRQHRPHGYFLLSRTVASCEQMLDAMRPYLAAVHCMRHKLDSSMKPDPAVGDRLGRWLDAHGLARA